MRLIELGASFRVVFGDHCSSASAPPPNRSVLVLLLGLADRGAHWSDRAELAQRLYPKSEAEGARAALRTALVRLRQWIGSDEVELSGARIRLAHEWTFAETASNPPFQTDHPWLADILRRRCATLASAPASIAASILSLTQTMIHSDLFAARSVLLAIHQYGRAASLKTLVELLRQTVLPDTDSREHLSHQMLLADAENRRGNLLDSVRRFERCWNVARARGDGTSMDRCVQGQIYNFAELGDRQRADDWAKRLACRTSIDSMNALGCLHWNFGEFDRALETMARAFALESDSHPKQSGHAAANYCYLAAELRLPEVVQKTWSAAAHYEPWITPHRDEGVLAMIHLMLAMQSRRFDEAYVGIEKMEGRCKTAGCVIGRIYTGELRAEILASDGRKNSAKKVWESCERWRAHKINAQINPRGLRNGRRIAALCA